MSFYFYDLETTGFDGRWDRIVQFAGQKVSEDFEAEDEPHNFLVKLSNDVLPSPDAVLITGITPQKTIQDGISEPELVKKLQTEVFKPNTTILGYNSIRFDDEFIRNLLYRNMQDPYVREYENGQTRWDLVDAVRMMRALRPEGIEWPIINDKPSNRLVDLSEANNLEHIDAHDALSDVTATIQLAKLLKKSQPKLFNHLYNLRSKAAVQQLINTEQPLVHSSDMLVTEYLKTSVVFPIAEHPTNPNAVLVFDLRQSPNEFKDLSVQELYERAFTPAKELMAKDLNRLPVKAVHINKSPALAPLGVLDEDSQDRIQLSIKKIETHLKELKQIEQFGQRVANAFEMKEYKEAEDVDAMMYDDFPPAADLKTLSGVLEKDSTQLADWHPKLIDSRYETLLFRYKARNYPDSLDEKESAKWDQYRSDRLNSLEGPMHFTSFFNRLGSLADEHKDDQEIIYLLEELQLYGESIAPFENETLL